VKASFLPLVLLLSKAPAPDLVDAQDSVPGLVVELRYAQADNFLKKALYPKGARCLLLRPVAGRLARAAEDVARQGYRLKAWDCYRPLSVQWEMWERLPKRGYVADPHSGSNHNRGAAVDVTLVLPDGREVEMPTPFDTFAPSARQDAPAAKAEVAQRRALLRAAMEAAGFHINRMEWWHYEAPEAHGAPLLDVPL
jgi:D-alanyl-D-alanine dipeptidase